MSFDVLGKDGLQIRISLVSLAAHNDDLLESFCEANGQMPVEFLTPGLDSKNFNETQLTPVHDSLQHAPGSRSHE